MRGLNIGNAFDAPNPGEWGVIIRPEYFKIISTAGFNTVRLPVRISAHTQSQYPYRIDESFLTQFDEMVNAGLESGLIVILDIHHYADIMKDPSGQKPRFLSIWEQLADHYKTFPDTLYFELLNEPSDKLDANTWNLLLVEGIQVVRQQNPTRKIIIDGNNFSDIESLKMLKLPADKNLLATFHFYEPFPFTHQGADWVEGADQWRGTTWVGTEAERKYIIKKMEQAAVWSKKQQVPIIMGEFGAIVLADNASRARWTSFVAREAEKYNIGWIHWQFCSDFPVYLCEENRWDLDQLNALIPDVNE